MKLPSELEKKRDERFSFIENPETDYENIENHNVACERNGFNAACEILLPLIENGKQCAEDLLRNIACDWYCQQLGANQRPSETASGLPAKVYNQEMLMRIKNSLEKARAHLKLVEETLG